MMGISEFVYRVCDPDLTRTDDRRVPNFRLEHGSASPWVFDARPRRNRMSVLTQGIGPTLRLIRSFWLANALVVLSCSTAEDGEIEVQISVGYSDSTSESADMHLFNGCSNELSSVDCTLKQSTGPFCVLRISSVSTLIPHPQSLLVRPKTVRLSRSILIQDQLNLSLPAFSHRPNRAALPPRVAGCIIRKCGLLVMFVARHWSRGWALSERRVYTISWNSDDEDQPMAEGRVVGAAGASAEERYKGRLNTHLGRHIARGFNLQTNRIIGNEEVEVRVSAGFTWGCNCSKNKTFVLMNDGQKHLLNNSQRLSLELWYKDGKAYPWHGGLSSFILYPESANQTVYSQSVIESDAGNYSCLVRNDTHTYSHTVNLTVIESSSYSGIPLVTYKPMSAVVELGDEARLFCEAFVGHINLPDTRNEVSWKRCGSNSSLPQQNRLQQIRVSR
uniref:(California timema) hypothetical protein n=1 Tax=Timema californicum TaxID=61474 RepID=A0A7R9J1S1_TIMCA|nr:unnamed protein product [Timema californicum]